MKESIVADLPQWPIDLCEKWLAPEAGKKGWPPCRNDDWRHVIGRDRDLSYLKSLRWEKVSMELAPDALSPKSRSLIVAMFRGYYLRDDAAFPFATFDGGRDRFEALSKFLSLNSRYPWPVALEEGSEGFDILDGHHRCLASFYLSGWFRAKDDDENITYRGYTLDYWIARPFGDKNGGMHSA